MKLINDFEPKLKNITASKLVSTYDQKREFPTIEMKLLEDVVKATVKFNFVYLKKNIAENKIHSEKYTRIISGASEKVYKLAAKQASRISLTLSSKFNDEWQRCLMNLLNKPSKNKSILNLGIYKKDGYGIYDVTHPSVLLTNKLNSSDIKQKTLASLSGVDETTLWRHLNGTAEISRDVAVKYAKALGCDPVEILFNDLSVPVWGSTDTQEMASIEKLSVYASEIIASKNLDNIKCPREIYRPDVKAIVIDQPNSFYHNHVAFYYNSVEPIVFEDQLVVVGTKLKNFNNNETRLRYFIGIYKKNKNGKTVDLHTIDPEVINVSGITPDEDFHTFDDVVGEVDQQKIVIDDIVPEFVAPVVALIDNSKVFNPVKREILKAYEKIYTQNRKQDFDVIDHFKRLQMRNLIQTKLEDYIGDDTEDHYQHMENQRIKTLIDADKKFQSIITTAAYGSTKTEKNIDLNEQVKKLNSELTANEQKVVEDTVAAYEDDLIHEEGRNQEPSDK